MRAVMINPIWCINEAETMKIAQDRTYSNQLCRLSIQQYVIERRNQTKKEDQSLKIR